MLSKENQSKIVGIKTGVSRRPKNWYLNDARYQLYQQLVAEHLDERLSRLNLTAKSEIVRTKMLEAAVRVAKNKAFNDLRRVAR